MQANGKVLTAGSIAGDALVVRLLADGSLDPTFGTGGYAQLDLGAATDDLRAIVLDGDGIVGTGITRRGAFDRPFLLRLADGNRLRQLFP